MSTTITYVTGDATRPQGKGNKVIAHINNDVGAWGAGFVIALSRRWDKPERMYRKWYKGQLKKQRSPFALGNAQFVRVEEKKAGTAWVANMIAQTGLGVKGPAPRPPIRYWALRNCLDDVANFAHKYNASVHMPRIGCGLAGAHWDEVEDIIKHRLCYHGIEVVVYDLEN